MILNLAVLGTLFFQGHPGIGEAVNRYAVRAHRSKGIQVLTTAYIQHFKAQNICVREPPSLAVLSPC